MDFARAHYDDGSVACNEAGVAIQRYYPWGSRRITYGEIHDVGILALGRGWSALQPWWVWGPVDLDHWWNLDPHRAGKKVAVVLDTGERFKPTVTPVDPDGFERVIRAHLHGLAQLREKAALARLESGTTPLIPPQRDEGAVVPQHTARPSRQRSRARAN